MEISTALPIRAEMIFVFPLPLHLQLLLHGNQAEAQSHLRAKTFLNPSHLCMLSCKVAKSCQMFECFYLQKLHSAKL